jgi:hypothetical protein
MMSNIFKGTQFSSFVFDLTLKKDKSLAKFMKTMNEAQAIRKRVQQPIVFLPALLHQKGESSIYPNTISIIQGQSGVHKSGIAQLICSSLIKKTEHNQSLLGFELQESAADIHVLYIDTERNLVDQFPFAIQKILIQGGYNISDNPKNLHYISFVSIPRKERQDLLDTYLKYYTKTIHGHLVVVLDVSTDFLGDFNSVNDTMVLSDLMNMMINQHNVTFICVIHENPGSEKARGHFGTEMFNKASTVIQVADVKNDRGIVGNYQLNYKKNRNTKRLPTLYFKYDEENRGLVELDAESVKELLDSQKKMNQRAQVIKILESLFETKDNVFREETLVSIENNFGVKDRTAETRLNEVLKNEVIISKNGIPHKLMIRTVQKKHQYYLLPLNQ